MAAIRGTPPKWKVQVVEELRSMLMKYPVVAVVGFRGVPSSQMQRIRRDLRGKVLIKVVKNSLLEKALDSLDERFKRLKDFLYDQTALAFSNMNSFELYRILEETKEPSFLKPGQVSPVDVVVEKGPTKFPPGPIVGELQNAGIPAAIERGKVVIKETTTVVRAGEVVKPEIAKALEKLDIRPIRIGLDVRAIYDNGVILTPDVLSIDPEEIKEQVVKAYQNALNLAVSCSYITRDTIEILIMKAFTNARNLAINACIYEKGVIRDLISKAYANAISLVSLLPDEALDDDLKRFKAEGVRVEERKEEERELKEEEKEEEEEKAEEEALEGLGALFG